MSMKEQIEELQAGLRHQIARVKELEAKCERYRAALDRLAMFDDAGGNDYLERTGTYSAFDEPVAVEVARTALKDD